VLFLLNLLSVITIAGTYWKTKNYNYMNSEKVLDFFKEITKIPRESGHEEKIGAYLEEFAAKRNLAFKKDAFGNILITKEATPGKENVPTLVFQSHQDMVCEKLAGVDFNFDTDPINWVIEDGWMMAKDTTLGADDGIGIASELALLDSDLPLGKIECVFTTSEETGLDGAFGMEPGFFTGKILINLDSEEEGEFCIGCAGGINTQSDFAYSLESFKNDHQVVQLGIEGAEGGHSGEDINKGRMNTVQVMAKFLNEELTKGGQLVSFEGGGKHNAIARETSAVVNVPDANATIERFNGFFSGVKASHALTDPEAVCTSVIVMLDPIEEPKAIDEKSAKALLAALSECPHGVQAMSKEIEGLVETSTNLASVDMKNDGVFHVVTSQRSSVTSECNALAERIRAGFESNGGNAYSNAGYPGWKPDVNSKILADCVASYKKLFGVEPIVKAIHAGLECGLFGEKFGGLDMISFGPTLLKVHTPGEKMDLASVDKFVELLVDVATNIK